MDMNSPGFLSGGGEMGARMRAMDWSATPLGPTAGWPQSLKTVVRVILDSRYSMWMAWGPELTFFYNDPYGRDTLGKKHPWALGKPAREVWSEIWHDIGPRIDRVLQSGQATWDSGLLLFLERNGYSEETYHTFSYSPLYDDDGQIGGMLCVVTEETDRIIAERRVALLRDLAAGSTNIKSEKEVFRLMEQCLQSDPRDLPFTLTYLFDTKNNIPTATARLASSTGLNASKIPVDADLWPLWEVEQTHSPVIVPIPIPFLDSVSVSPWQKLPTQAAIIPIAHQGQSFPAGVIVAGLNPHRPFDDGYRGFLSLFVGQIASQLSNSRAYEEERLHLEALAELDRAKTAFFSNVSHEFRTPLTLMLGPLEDSINQANGIISERARLELTTAHRNGLRLLKLVNTLLAFSRIEAGRMEAVFEPCDLSQYTAELASVFRSTAEKAGLQLVVDCPPLSEPVYIDRSFWEKIVLNLLSNAFKFTFVGTISVRLTSSDNEVRLSVRDSGCGIPENELPRLFERFHRVEGTRGRTHEGTGIGLALVRELVLLHKGSVEAESQVDVGSTLTVRIPLGSSHLPQERIRIDNSRTMDKSAVDSFVEEAMRWLPSETEERQSSYGQEDRASSRNVSGFHRIVLADDNADMRDYVNRMLTARGFVVEAVADGEAALDAVRRRRPDLVITDVMMPKLDGFGLLRHLRADSALSDVPVMMLSARAGEEATVEGLEAGVDDYLIKPFSARELVAKVEGRIAMAESRIQLHRQAAQFETLLNEAPMGVFLIDADFRIVQGNPTAMETFEKIPDVIGRDFNEVVHRIQPKIYADEISELFRNTLETGDPYVAPEHIKRRHTTGNPEYYEWQIHRLPLPDGRYGVVCYFRNISTHVLARQAAVAAENQLRLVADHAPVYIAHCDTECRYKFVNRRYADRFGLRPEDIIGRRIPEILGDDAFAQFEHHVKHVLAGNVVTHETEIPYKVGGRLFMHIEYVPERNVDGKVIGFVAALSDITARKRADEAMRKQAELLDISHEAVISREIDGKITYWNHGAEELYGFSKAEATGTISHSLLSTVFPRPLEEIQKHLLQFGRWEGELVHKRKDGSALISASRWVLRRGMNGSDDSVMEIDSDITLQKRNEDRMREASMERERLLDAERAARAEAERANRLKEDFLSTLSHELRTPLNAILGWTSILERGAPNAETLREGLSVISRNARAQTQLIEDLLDMSRITSGKLRLELQPVDLAESLAAAVESLRPVADAREIQLTRSFDAKRTFVMGDSQRLQQVAWNVISNAIKFTPKGGSVQVVLMQNQSQLEFSVIDNGKGIHPEFLPYVFERFRQADATSKRAVGGLGLGLAIVKQLVELHGGTVHASSAGEGLGSKFTVTLPLVSVQTPALELSDLGTETSRLGPPISLDGITVLVVDDELDVRDLIRHILDGYSAIVVTAGSVVDAMEAFHKHRPHVIVSDIGMPEQDGYEFIRLIRKLRHEEGGQTPAAALTAYARMQDRRQALMAGYQMHIVKPADPLELVTVIASLAGRLDVERPSPA